MVEHILAKDGIRVRFPVPAPQNEVIWLWVENSILPTPFLSWSYTLIYSRKSSNFNLASEKDSLKTVDKTVDMCIKDIKTVHVKSR